MLETALTSRSTFLVPTPRPGAAAVGSDNLNPEKIVSYELDYLGWYFKHRVQMRGALYFNHITDLIGRVSISPTAIAFVNNGTADIHGLEAGVEFLATKWLTGFVNYNYEEIGQSFIIRDLRRGAPIHKINAGLRGEWDNGLSAAALVHYVSGAAYPLNAAFTTFAGPPFFGPPPPNERVTGYTLVNLRVAYQFWRERAEIAASVFNALNDRHLEHPLGDVIGTRAMGWLTIRY